MAETRTPGKRGRRAPSHEPTLRLTKFAPPASKPPPSGDVSSGITDWGMLGNDTHSDCGAAAFQHGRMAKSGKNVLDDNGKELAADSKAATKYTLASYYAYGRAMGEPGEHPDEGVDNATWLKFLFDQGMIEGYAELDVTNSDEVHMAMLNFNGVLLGCDLTADAEQQFAAHQPWTITAKERPSPKEGHDIYLVKYDTQAGNDTIVTWGALQECTLAWNTGEVQAGDLEAWVFITAEDAERNGVNMAELQQAIRSLGGTTASATPVSPTTA
jgi:hypothetical protein